jgi:hypothetical protein
VHKDDLCIITKPENKYLRTNHIFFALIFQFSDKEVVVI